MSSLVVVVVLRNRERGRRNGSIHNSDFRKTPKSLSSFRSLFLLVVVVEKKIPVESKNGVSPCFVRRRSVVFRCGGESRSGLSSNQAVSMGVERIPPPPPFPGLCLCFCCPPFDATAVHAGPLGTLAWLDLAGSTCSQLFDPCRCRRSWQAGVRSCVETTMERLDWSNAAGVLWPW